MSNTLSSSGAAITYPTVTPAELERLLALRSQDPHAVLGAHPTPQGVVVRAFRPGADSVELLTEGDAPRPMIKVHGAGFFELVVEGRAEPFPYLLRVNYPGGSLNVRDPYAFLPTVGPLDEHLFNEGRHWRIYDKLGAHVRQLGGVHGVSFAVWAPSADAVSLVGDFNNWDGRIHQMRRLGGSGIWELFVPDLGPGALYKYEIRRGGVPLPFLKTDPYALYTEVPPATSSIVYEPTYRFTDDAWMRAREGRDHLRSPLNIYEVHLGSWRRVPEQGNRSLTYRETAPALADYCREMGFTHVEFLPLKGHPYEPSWGYQVANYFAPTARYGTPDDFRFLVDYLHNNGVGVIMDWVPAHFPKDAWALGRFDGSALYEHADPRQGEHPDWGTYIFNYGRNEVRNFLIANALFWLRENHIDGLRVDAVASMLYLDYSRSEGRWIPNKYGGRENIEAIDFIRELNTVIKEQHPGVMLVAEESTSWPLVSKGADRGGLGFDFKWNMGWMHDTLEYFKRDPLFRRYFHNNLTFGLTYAWSENFILPFSHDEVVHMKGSMLNKMPGTRPQKFANLRALYAYMWAHPGKKLLFMGAELGQWREWNDAQSLDWHLLDEDDHRGVRALVRDLNSLVAARPALYELDVEPHGFRWVDVNNELENVVSFLRFDSDGRAVVCVCNFSAVPRPGYRFGLPEAGTYRVILNTDAPVYAGTGSPQTETVEADARPWHDLPFSAALDLPPLTTLWLEGPPKANPAPADPPELVEETTPTPEPQEATPSETVEPPAPKPKKPRAPRKKTAPPPIESQAAPAPEENTQGKFEEKSARKPAKKAAAKRAPRKKTE